MEWVQTWSGRKLTPREIRPEQVGGIEEIAHVLAAKVRFNGHTFAPYSVAEHCVRGARLLPRSVAGAFLLHELGEVYLPDVPSPIKRFLQVETEGCDPEGDSLVMPWEDLERQHEAAILEALGLLWIHPVIHSEPVRRMDLAMLVAEHDDLMGPAPEPWGIDVPRAATGQIQPWDHFGAKRAFLAAFAELFA